MNAQRLALYLDSRSLLYFRHVICHLPVEDVDIFVPPSLLQAGRDSCPVFREIEEKGYRFCSVEQARGRYGAVGFAGFLDMEQKPVLAGLAERRILMLHASAFQFVMNHMPFTHVLCQFENQINLGNDRLFLHDGKMRSEVYPAGPYQLGEWETRRLLPRDVLRTLLQKTLGAPIPEDRELILYCGGLHDQPLEHVDAIRMLADSRTVLFKPYYDNPAYSALTGHPFVHLIRDTLHVSPNAMRFAADIILTSPISGVFTTSLLLRQRVLPFFTWHQSSARRRDVFTPWKATLPPDNALPELHIARILGGPFDNKTLLHMEKLMSSPQFWRMYADKLNGILPTFFGRYSIEGASLRAACGLLNVARFGTFTPEETA